MYFEKECKEKKLKKWRREGPVIQGEEKIREKYEVEIEKLYQTFKEARKNLDEYRKKSFQDE